MDRILWWVFYYFTIYAFLPGFVSRTFGLRAFRRGRTEREVSLTFDDGPDPKYTPQLLDLLREHGAKATFFVVGAHAEKYPELVKRIYDEGHDLGIHNYVHKSNWVMRPRTVKRHVQRTSDILEGITGAKPRFYRPPWGIINIFDFVRRGSLQIVLWTSMFGDWKVKVGADNLYAKMKEKLGPGQVFLLHDRGDTLGADPGAPANTIEAVRRILEDGRKLGLRFVGIGEMMELTERFKAAKRSGRSVSARENGASRDETAAASSGVSKPRTGPFKRAVVAVWLLWEKLFRIVFRLRPVGDRAFMHYRIRKYGGPDLQLKDSSWLRRGDVVMEMHFDNAKMYELGMNSRSALQIAIKLIRETEHALPDFAREAEQLPDGHRIRALYGVTMVNRGAEGLGFETYELPPGLFAASTNWYLRLMMRIIRPDGGKRGMDNISPRAVIMTRERLARWRDDSVPVRPAIRTKQASERAEHAEFEEEPLHSPVG
ncbi:polysaccharide deacetylase family protein [Cohnella massiliensis]|uniref:polysaccharide deacetylase family protein n=2 Tax=Cohnella TaxID=329857 RepID=UPI0009B98D23|nr:polysaccharide deacetylase family protein [Cohnella massiliensis]